MIRSLKWSCYLINLSFTSLIVSLVVFVLFIFAILGKKNSQIKPLSVSSWVIIAFRGVIAIILKTLITTLSLLMSHSLRIPFFFLPSVARSLVLDVLSIPLALPSPNFPSPPTNVVTRPLQVYTRRPRPCPPTWSRAESSSMSQSSPAPVLQPFDDLPVAIQKVTLSTSNPHPVYNFLSFHRLSTLLCLYFHPVFCLYP